MAEVLVGPLEHGQDVLAMRYERALAGFEVITVTQEIGAVALVTHDRDFSRLPSLHVLPGAAG